MNDFGDTGDRQWVKKYCNKNTSKKELNDFTRFFRQALFVASKVAWRLSLSRSLLYFFFYFLSAPRPTSSPTRFSKLSNYLGFSLTAWSHSFDFMKDLLSNIAPRSVYSTEMVFDLLLIRWGQTQSQLGAGVFCPDVKIIMLAIFLLPFIAQDLCFVCVWEWLTVVRLCVRFWVGMCVCACMCVETSRKRKAPKQHAGYNFSEMSQGVIYFWRPVLFTRLSLVSCRRIWNLVANR